MGRVTEMTLDGIAHGGEAIGKHAGKVVFVPYAIPGERVRVEIVEEKEKWARARLIEVLEASLDRVSPPCPFFGPGKCGGCQWQHIAYPRQADLKRDIVVDQLRRLGRIDKPPVADTIALIDPASPDEVAVFLDYGYRDRMHFGITSGGKTGLPRAGGNDLMPVDFCLLVNEQIDALQTALDTSWSALSGVTFRASAATGEALVILETNGEEQPELEIDLPAAFALDTPKALQPLIGDPVVTEEVNGRRYRISAQSYFPANTAGAAALVDVVLNYLEARPGQTVLDAFCGVGLFSMPIADEGAQVIGLESSPVACEDFAFNAGDRDNVLLHEGSVEQILPALLSEGQRADAVVLDAPRSGVGAAVLELFAALEPQRLIYLASDPAALSRDGVHLTILGYKLRETQPVDLAPQTFMIETVSLWERVQPLNP